MGNRQNHTAKLAPVISIDTDARCIECGASGKLPNGFCLKCVASAARFEVPRPHEFVTDEGRETDFLLSADLAEIGRHLIKTYEDDFADIADAEIDYFWKKKGGSTGGKVKLGALQKPSGILRYYSQKDYLMWLAADNLFHANRFTITAVVFHELLHGWYNPANGLYDLRAHEFEGFSREIDVFGLYKSDMKSIASAFTRASQRKLFGK